MADPVTPTEERWLAPGVRGIGAASFLAAALGLIEGVSDGLAGAARLAGGAIADDPRRRRARPSAATPPPPSSPA
jgi:hypothetical protein